MKKLYTEKQTNVAAFLGGPVPAGILIYKNFTRLGKEKEAYTTIAATLIFTVSFAFILLKLPDEIMEKVPNVLFALIYGVISAAIFRAFLAEEIEAQIEQGVQRASNWGVAGYTLLGLVINLLIILGVALMEPPFPGEKLSFGASNNEVYYDATEVSKSEVDQLADELYALGYFTDEFQTILHFTRGKSYMLTFQVDAPLLEDTELESELKALTWSLEDTFGTPFTIILENYDLSGKRKSKMIQSKQPNL